MAVVVVVVVVVVVQYYNWIIWHRFCTQHKSCDQTLNIFSLVHTELEQLYTEPGGS